MPTTRVRVAEIATWLPVETQDMGQQQVGTMKPGTVLDVAHNEDERVIDVSVNNTGMVRRARDAKSKSRELVTAAGLQPPPDERPAEALYFVGVTFVSEVDDDDDDDAAKVRRALGEAE